MRRQGQLDTLAMHALEGTLFWLAVGSRRWWRISLGMSGSERVRRRACRREAALLLVYCLQYLHTQTVDLFFFWQMTVPRCPRLRDTWPRG